MACTDTVNSKLQADEMMFQTLIDRLKEALSQRRAAKARARAREEEILSAIEHVVDEINPKLRAVSRYRKKLRPAVERALAYSTEIVARVPGPVEVNRTAWSKDSQLRAFFTGVEDMRQVLSDNREVHDFFAGHADAEQPCYALLSMERSERTVLGMEGSGDIIKRDVLQTSVSFKDRKVVEPDASELHLRQDLEQRAFEVLVAYVLERITGLLADRHSLNEQKLLLDMQLRLAQAKNASLSPLLEGSQNEGEPQDALQQRQQHTTQAFEQANARLTTLDDYIDRITEVLGHPAEHFKANQIALRLSQMNIKRDDKSSAPGHDLELTELSLGEEIRRILLIIRFPCDELLEKKGLF
jgi:hypothetical protein